MAKEANCDEDTILLEALTLYRNYLGIKEKTAVSAPSDRVLDIVAAPDKGVIFAEVVAGLKQRNEKRRKIPADAPIENPYIRKLFSQVMSGIAKRQNSTMTADQRVDRASKGGSARADSLSPARRKEIAIKASLAAKKKREET